MCCEISTLVETGLSPERAAAILREVEQLSPALNPTEVWHRLSNEVLTTGDPFDAHLLLYKRIYRNRPDDEKPAWIPSAECVKNSNVASMMNSLGLSTYEDLHRWSTQNWADYWSRAIEELHVRYKASPTEIVEPGEDGTAPRWLPGGSLNIVDTVFANAPVSAAIVWHDENGGTNSWTADELKRLTSRVAAGLEALGVRAGDAVAIDMPMTAECVAIYLGIIAMGGIAVSIADSFAAPEIQTRVRLGNARLIFTQDVIHRGGKELPLYKKIVAADAPPAVVLPAGSALTESLRDNDIRWDAFLPSASEFKTVSQTPDAFINILFSSGTTGDPKAIPWTQTTPVKCAADARYHQDIHPGDVLAWPTNLGWMMGPWLIFAALMNRASIALYYGAPTDQAFGKFVQDTGVTMLGIVPSIVSAWRESRCMEAFDWSRIKVFSSTGECSNEEDMFYLMWLAGYKPVIEYCGGTEIGGGYITGTVVKPAVPATFNTLALGTDAVVLDECGVETENGELFLFTPSIGYSTELLNRDHREVYFAGTPLGPGGQILRRHGDQMERLPGGYFRAHGRIDDTMNLGGIKVSSAEVERVLNQLPGVSESAAIAATPEGGGPSLLVVYVVCENESTDTDEMRAMMQGELKQQLNPLFRIHEVLKADALPRTASNKVMRRVLRARYLGLSA
jgi:acetyl-CoA synthetase